MVASRSDFAIDPAFCLGQADTMNETLATQLLEMADTDARVRTDLLNRGVLFDGYHPEMERIHNANADALLGIITTYGWPSRQMVGDAAAAAAWLVVQHAIGKPDFQRHCLALLKNTYAPSAVDPAHIAHLEDRIRAFEGKPQIYGTQFDWDEKGQMNPKPIENPDTVDERRHSVGLPPLRDAIARIQETVKRERAAPPADMQQRNADFLAWAKKAGWRE